MARKKKVTKKTAAKATPKTYDVEEDFNNMPKELREQLVDPNRNTQHGTLDYLQTLINELDEKGLGVDVNHIIVGYYNKHGKIIKRQTMLGRLGYMTQIGMIRRVNTGVYGRNK